MKKITIKNPSLTKEQRDVIREFLKYTKKSFLFAGFFSLFINVLMLLPAIYMLAVYDIAVPSRSTNTLIVITGIVIILYIIMAMLQAIRGKILVRINNRIDYLLNKKVINSMYDFALKYPSKASTQPFTDFQQIKQFLTGPSIFAFFDLPWTPIFLAVLFVFHPYYGYMSVGVIAIVLLITVLNEFATRKYLKQANEALIKENKFLNNTLNNVEVIHAMGMKNNIYNRWLQLHRDYMFNLQTASDKAAMWSNLVKVVRIMSQSLMLGLGGYLAMNMEISMGMIVAGSIVLGRALAPLDLIINTWKGFVSARMSYKRLNLLLSEFEEEEGKFKLPQPKGQIDLYEVVVVPPEGKEPVLKNITMHINAGETIAVVGPSGAGKSTLARAIVGVWPTAHGLIEIDGADLRQWDKEYLGRYIGYLPQDIELFEGTIAENIARFGQVDEEKVIQAAKLSGAHDIIVKLPDGYNTYIGPGGITLSGGQRQRVALARAIYDMPKILVLDEPNSNLDDAGEKALLQALINMKKQGTTIIIVSHKVNILNIVDKIAVIKDGVLSMYGQTAVVLEKLTKAQRG